MTLPSDEAKFRMVFDAHHDAIQRYCVRRLDPDRANDASAEVFLVAWRRLDAVPEPADALPWLYRVARNVVWHFHRSQQRYRNLTARVADCDPPEGEPSPVMQVIRREEDSLVVAAMDELRDSDRELLRLKIWEELPHAEIGEALGVSAHAIDMRFNRALKRLARALHGVEHRVGATAGGDS